MLFHPTHSVSAEGDVLATHPPAYIPGPYTRAQESTGRVPSLVSLCIRVLVPFPDQVHQLPVRLNLRPHHARALVDDLIPDPAAADPRLWVTLVQIYDALPSYFASYTAPLADIHLPLLQSIPSSAAFSLVTVLDLPACVQLTDDTILQLKFLHTLTAFDASQTALTAYGVKSLAATLQIADTDDSSHRGPWQLRILALRNCTKITNDVFPSLDKFPLLSVIDLRGTRCTPNHSSPFLSCDNDDLFFPTPIKSALTNLQAAHANLYSSSSPYLLHIDTLYYRPTRSTPQASTVAPQDAFVVIPSNNARIKVGNTHILDRDIQAREKALAHARNKDAWYERQERLESRMDEPDENETRKRNHLRQQADTDLSSFIKSSNQQPHKSLTKDATRISRSSWIGVSPSSAQSVNISIPSTIQPNRGLPTSAILPTTRNIFASISNGHTAARPGGTISPSLVNRFTISGSERIARGGGRGEEFASSRRVQSQEALSGATSRVDASPAPQLPATGNAHVNPTTHSEGSERTILPVNGERPQVSSFAAPESFYETLPRDATRLVSHGKRVMSESYSKKPRHSDNDTRLRLFRVPAAWAFLGETLLTTRAREAEARQHRAWQRLGGKAEETAVVDMTSGKAEMARKRLEEVVRRDILERRPISASISAVPASVFSPIQPVASRNPFRRRASLPAKSDIPHSLRSSTRSSENDTAVIASRLPLKHEDPPSGVKAEKPKLVPISAVKIPVLSAEMRVEALARERKADSESVSGSSMGGGSTRKKAKVADTRKVKESKTKTQNAFDWKGWGKGT